MIGYRTILIASLIFTITVRHLTYSTTDEGSDGYTMVPKCYNYTQYENVNCSTVPIMEFIACIFYERICMPQMTTDAAAPTATPLSTSTTEEPSTTPLSTSPTAEPTTTPLSTSTTAEPTTTPLRTSTIAERTTHPSAIPAVCDDHSQYEDVDCSTVPIFEIAGCIFYQSICSPQTVVNGSDASTIAALCYNYTKYENANCCSVPVMEASACVFYQLMCSSETTLDAAAPTTTPLSTSTTAEPTTTPLSTSTIAERTTHPSAIPAVCNNHTQYEDVDCLTVPIFETAACVFYHSICSPQTVVSGSDASTITALCYNYTKYENTNCCSVPVMEASACVFYQLMCSSETTLDAAAPTTTPLSTSPTAEPTTTQPPATSIKQLSTVPAASTCVDLSDCAGFIGLCDDPRMIGTLSTHCPRTCGFCPDQLTATTALITPAANFASVCKDLSDCTHFSTYCKRSDINSSLRKYCAKTCGFC